MLIIKLFKVAIFIIAFFLVIIYSQRLYFEIYFRVTNKSDFNDKLNLIKKSTSDLFNTPNLKEFSIAYSFTGVQNKFKAIDYHLIIEEAYDIERARILIIRYYLQVLKTINSKKFLSECLFPFPFEINNVSFFISFYDKNISILYCSPYISKVRADRGGIEYLSLSRSSKEYLTPSWKEDFFSAYESVKSEIDPDLRKVAEGLKIHNVKLPNIAQTHNDYISGKTSHDLFPNSLSR